MVDYRKFIHLGRAWYGPANLTVDRYVDEIWFGFDEQPGELMMRWYQLGAGAPSPRLEVFNDSFRVLMACSDMLEVLAEHNGKDFTPDEFCRLLLRLGFRDETPVDEERHESLKDKIQKLIESERQK